MSINSENAQKVTPEQALKILAKDGIVITHQQAQEVLDFMYKMANIALDILEEEEQRKRLGNDNADGSNPTGF